MIAGSFTVYIDLSETLKLPPGTIDMTCNAFNVPYSLYTEGSYFGDSDCLTDLLLPVQKKYYRDSTAEASDSSEVMLVTRSKLDEQLKLFPEIRRYMVAIAREKLKYHKILIQNVVTRYQDP